MRIRKILCFVLLFMLVSSPLISLGVYADNDTNLALKKSYTIEYDSPIENGFPNLVNDDEDKKLTDGFKASATTSDGAWLKLYRGTAITVTIDLGAVNSVNRVNLGQLQVSGAGIHCARYVHVAVSENGSDYGTVGSKFDKNSVMITSVTKINHNITLDQYYKARYVRLIFSSDVWSYNDEIEVFGKTDAGIGVIAAIDEPVDYPNAFPTDIDGLKNIVLMYSGEYYKGSKSDIGVNTYEQIMPYFAYIDKQLKPVDTMFDGMLFLPLTPTGTPSTGGEDYSFEKMNGWKYYLDNVIGVGIDANITALDRLVEEYREQLDLGEDYKYPVYISVPYIEFSNTVVFDEIDGEALIPSNLENRSKIVEWFVDYVISSFNAAGFKNVQLNGLYWHHELVPYSKSDHEDDLIIAYNEYVHSKGYTSIWIPYYCAPGFETWKELGFDAAVMQNGYAFLEHSNEQTGPKKAGVVDDALAQSKKYGLGMELETSGHLNGGDQFEEAYKRYYKCIHAAFANGLMDNGLVMYYQGGGPGTLYTCAKSSKANVRSAYDLTYQYIKKTFTSFPPAIEEDQFIIVKKGSKVSANITVSDADTPIGILKTANITKAQNILMSADGAFIVLNASGDFVGEDSFTLQITDGFNVSDEVTVRILVVEDLIRINSFNRELKDNSAVIYNEKGKTTETGDNAFEVVVNAENKIESVGGYNNTIPDGGFVIAARGSAQSYLTEYAKKGMDVIYDKTTDSVIFTGEGVDTVNDKEDNDKDKGYLIWIIIGACMLVFAGVAAFSIISKSKKGAV